MSYLLFDIGGTNTRITISKDSGVFYEPKKFSTSNKLDNFLAKFCESVSQLKEENNIDQIPSAVGGVPGNLYGGLLKRSPNLESWIGNNIAEKIEQRLGIETTLLNDADLNGLGEDQFGAGRSFDILVYLTISTGVGGTKIIDGKIVRNKSGFEPGHQIIETNRLDNYQDLESLAAGSGIETKYGQKPSQINDEEIWQEVMEYLAIGVHNTILHWSPEVLILGGGVMEHAIEIKQLRKKVKEITNIFTELPVFKETELGDHNGLYGALAYSHKLNN